MDPSKCSSLPYQVPCPHAQCYFRIHFGPVEAGGGPECESLLIRTNILQGREDRLGMRYVRNDVHTIQVSLRNDLAEDLVKEFVV